MTSPLGPPVEVLPRPPRWTWIAQAVRGDERLPADPRILQRVDEDVAEDSLQAVVPASDRADLPRPEVAADRGLEHRVGQVADDLDVAAAAEQLLGATAALERGALRGQGAARERVLDGGPQDCRAPVLRRGRGRSSRRLSSIFARYGDAEAQALGCGRLLSRRRGGRSAPRRTEAWPSLGKRRKRSHDEAAAPDPAGRR